MNIIKKIFSREKHVCPAGISFVLGGDMRKLIHNPEKLFSSMVRAGSTVIDIGCGPGFFSVGLAQLVGNKGKVLSLDIQPEMLEKARHRAEKAGMLSRIAFIKPTPDSLGITEKADFILTFWMAHEVPDQTRLFREIKTLLKPGGKYLLAEPKMHVWANAYKKTVDAASAAGLHIHSNPRVALSRATLFTN